jgi:ABC-type multidrug transport system fused ATPase/permease subunit
MATCKVFIRRQKAKLDLELADAHHGERLRARRYSDQSIWSRRHFYPENEGIANSKASRRDDGIRSVAALPVGVYPSNSQTYDPNPEYSSSSCCLQGAGLLIPAATGIAILHHPERTAGWAGYTLSIIQFVTEAIYELIMQIGQIDVALVTVERLEECKPLTNTHSSMVLTFQADSQLPSEIESKAPRAMPDQWPSLGHIQIERLSASYDMDLSDVLHDVGLEIFPSERIGVVGRT